MNDQLSLDLPIPKQWGGVRDGAGRKRLARNHDPEHRRRTRITRSTPVHVVLRTARGVPRLRKGPVYRAIRRSLARMLGRAELRIVHLSIQRNHLHLIVEADHARALSEGMQGFAISAARAINKVHGRSGKVFAYRYHATRITSPRQARHCLSYVLNNWRRHDEDEGSVESRFAKLDPYSSAILFAGWKEGPFGAPSIEYEPLPVARATCWLLTVGWERHGPISAHEVPGPMRTR